MAQAYGAARWKQEVLGLQRVTHPSQLASPAPGVVRLHCRAPSLAPPSLQPCPFSSPRSHWFEVWCPAALLAHLFGHRFTGVSLKHLWNSTCEKKFKKKGGGGHPSSFLSQQLESPDLPLTPPAASLHPNPKKCVLRHWHRRKCLQRVVRLG